MSCLRTFAIHTSRLLIRRLFLGEVDDYITCLNQACAVGQLPWMSMPSAADAWAFATHQATVNPGGPNVHAWLVIVEQQTSRIIGVCSIKADKLGQQGEVSVALVPSWRGRGYEQEAIKGLVHWTKCSAEGPRLRQLVAKVDVRDTSLLSAFGAAGLALVSQGLWDGQFSYYVLAI